jgi:hypothetical protein
MKKRLSKCEQNAKNMMADALRDSCKSINVDWVKSRTWGKNPVIKYHGEKCCSVSGCGYDKLSAALAEVCCWLFPEGSKERSEIHSCSGAGERTIIATLARFGWELKKLAEGDAYDCYLLTKKAGETY